MDATASISGASSGPPPGSGKRHPLPLCSLVIPCKDARDYLDECLGSVLAQTYPLDRIEASIYDDGSTDGSQELVLEWGRRFEDAGVRFVFSTSARSHENQSQSQSQENPHAPGLPHKRAKLDPEEGTKPKKLSKEQRKLQRSLRREEHLQAYRRVEGVEHNTGVAFARNQSLGQCTGDLVFILDADDVMMPDRLAEMVRAYEAVSAAKGSEVARKTLYGSQFERIPPGSMPRYTEWSNGLTQRQLMTSRFRECTIACPTWMLARSWLRELGDFDQRDWRSEDLLLFYKHIERGGELHKVMKPLVLYRYLPFSASFKLHRKSLLHVKIEAMERQLMGLTLTLTSTDASASAVVSASASVCGFCIVGSGKGGKEFYRGLSEAARRMVTAFVDFPGSESDSGAGAGACSGLFIDDTGGPGIPIVPWGRAGVGARSGSGFEVSATHPAFVLLPIRRTAGLEEAVAEKGWIEGVDYYQVA